MCRPWCSCEFVVCSELIVLSAGAVFVASESAETALCWRGGRSSCQPLR